MGIRLDSMGLYYSGTENVVSGETSLSNGKTSRQTNLTKESTSKDINGTETSNVNSTSSPKGNTLAPLAMPLTIPEMEENLDSIAVTTYGRIMIVGPSAVGKTSLKHGLMNRPLPVLPESTRLAEMKQIKYEWARAIPSYWEVLTDKHEYEELARLLSRVHELPLNPIKESTIAALLSKPLIPKQAAYFMSPFLSPAGKFLQHKLKVQEVKKEVVEAVKEEQFQKILKKAFDIAWSAENPTKASSMQAQHHSQSNVDPDVLMNVWDCGGQAMFLEILPAFLTSRTMFILAFDASKDLDVVYKDVLHINGTRQETEEQPCSMIDLLMRWIASIHAHLARYDVHHKLGGFPRILMIGTHKDQMKEGSMNEEQLREAISAQCQGKAFSDLILDIKFVDNTTAGLLEGEDPVFQEIRDMVHQFASQELTEKTQISWVLFRKLLDQYRKELNKPILTFSEAVAIGIACRIPEDHVPLVLNFYHELGVILYYANIPSMREVVICDPQWLIQQFTMVFSLEDHKKCRHFRHWNLLCSQGILTSSFYEAIWHDSQVESQALVDLMEHFLLATPIVCNTRKRYIPAYAKEYFVPSMLKIYKPSDTDETAACSRQYYQQATPLFLLFNTGYVVAGFFTRFIAVLVKHNHFEISFQRGVYRNRVVLEYGQPNATRIHEVIVTEHLENIEINVARCFPSKHNFRQICRNILRFILNSSEEVLQWLPSIHVDPGLICWCDRVTSSVEESQTDSPHYRRRLHLAPAIVSSGTETPPHASVTPTLSSSPSSTTCVSPHFVTFTFDHDSKSCLSCDRLEHVVPLPEHRYWLKSESDIPKSISPCKPSFIGSINLHQIGVEIGDYLPLVASLLGLENELKAIENDPFVTSAADSFMKKWNELSGDISDLAEVLYEIGLTELADKIKPLLDIPLKQQKQLERPMCLESLKGPEILYISTNINGGQMEALAAQLDTLNAYYDICRDSNVINKKLHFLQQWCIMKDNRAELSTALNDIGLHKHAEIIRCGDFVQQQEDGDPMSCSPGSRKNSQCYGPPVTPIAGSGSPDLLTLADITECSRHIITGEHDLHLLAIALDVKDEEYEHLKKTNSHPCGLALHLLKIYRNQNKGTKEDLRGLLSSVKHKS